MDIPITKVVLGEPEERLVLEVLRSGQLAQGPMVERLEEGFASLTATRHAVAVTSGTTALVAAIKGLELQAGDEVITSPFTFVATLNAILEAGAVARFADIGPDFNISAEHIEPVIGPRTRVVMPVHLYGLPADMGPIASLAAANELAVIEDAAQAIGAEVDGQPVGGAGAGCFSLYATKNIMTGEGGVLTTNDEALADKVRVLRNQGMRRKYDYVMAGHNYRMTDLQAAVGVAQLGRVPEITKKRQLNAAALTQQLDGVPGLVLPFVPPNRTHVFHQYTVRIEPDARIDRDELAARLGAAGVGSGVYYPRPVYDYEVYRDHPNVAMDATPGAVSAAAQVLSLPVHPQLSEREIEVIASSLRASLEV